MTRRAFRSPSITPAAPAHVYIAPHCTELDLAMPFIAAIAPATLPSAISWRRVFSRAHDPKHRLFLYSCATARNSFRLRPSNGRYASRICIHTHGVRTRLRFAILLTCFTDAGLCATYMAYTTAMDVDHLMHTLVRESGRLRTQPLELSNRNNTNFTH